MNKIFDHKPRLTQGYSTKHLANDFAGRPYYGDPIRMPFDGYIQIEPPGQFKVNNQHSDCIACKAVEKKNGQDTGKTYLFLHLSRRNEDVMQSEIKAGTVIGWVGNTGYVLPAVTPAKPYSGTHVHVESKMNGKHYNNLDEVMNAYESIDPCSDVKEQLGASQRENELLVEQVSELNDELILRDKKIEKQADMLTKQQAKLEQIKKADNILQKVYAKLKDWIGNST